MDITDNELLGSHNLAHFQRTINYPVKTAFEDVVKPMLAKLDKKNMKENLEKFTNFKTRFYLVSSSSFLFLLFFSY
jgi:leucyl aminopeptidase